MIDKEKNSWYNGKAYVETHRLYAAENAEKAEYTEKVRRAADVGKSA